MGRSFWIILVVLITIVYVVAQQQPQQQQATPQQVVTLLVTQRAQIEAQTVAVLNDIPALIAQIEKLQKENAELKAQLAKKEKGEKK